MTVIIHADYIITMDDTWRVLRDAAVIIEGERITMLGDWTALHARFPHAEIVGDGTGMLLPGFINAHTHFSEGLLPSLGDGMSLYEWAERVIIPAGRCLDREKARIGTLIKGCELLASGVTTVNDMFVHTNPNSFASLGTVDALEQLGMRAFVSFGAEDVDFNNPQADKPALVPIESVLEEHYALLDRTRAVSRIGFRLGIGTLSGQTAALLAASVNLAKTESWSIHTHLAEAREEVTYFRTRYGMTPVAYAAQHGLLDCELLAAHCNWLTEHDLMLLHQSDVRVIHNPVANMLLASGVCPAPRILGMGIPICLGTDGAASNNNQNMFQLMKIAALLHKIVALDAAAMSARQIVWMATRGGARALGLEADIGSLEVGKRADMVLLDGKTATLAPTHDPYGQIVYAATGREVSAVWVDGEQLVRDGRVLTVEEASIAIAAREAATDLLAHVPELQPLSQLLHRDT